MALKFDSAGTGLTNQSPGTAVTWTHTVGALTNGLLIAGVKSGGSATLSNLVFAGQSLTKYVAGTSATAMSVDVWFLKNPPAGLGTFNGTYTAGGGTNKIGVSLAYGSVNQTTPLNGSVLNNPGITTSTSGSIVNTTLARQNLFVGFQGLTVSPGTTAIGVERGTTAQAAASNELMGAESTGGTLRWTNASARILDVGVYLSPFSYASSTLTDDFTAGTQDLTKWTNAFGSISYTNGAMDLVIRLNNTGYSGIDSLDAYDMTSSYFNCQVTAVPSQGDGGNESFFSTQYSGSQSTNALFIYINSGNISWWQKLNNVSTQLSSTTYDANVHKYIQIRESAGTSYYEYSTDGINYTGFGSITNIFAMTNMVLEISAGNFNASHSAGSFSVDNVNIAATPPVTSSYTTFMTLMGVGNI